MVKQNYYDCYQLLFFMTLLLLASNAFAKGDFKAIVAEIVPIYTYHNGGPFITDKQLGLTYELADYLNTEAEGKWVFPVIKQARLRFNRDVKTADIGIVPWVKPAWLKKLSLSHDLWSLPYFKDANVIISRMDNKIEYTAPASLFGHTIAKVKGAVQVGIDPYIKSGQIKVVNSTGFEGHIRMLNGGRADFVSTSLNIAKYTIARLNLESNLYISMRPIDLYTRHIMVFNNRQDFMAFINQSIL
jgi:polar amino acid transport system substrate-binding protein